MQLTPRYLVNNRTTIVSNDVGIVTEYRPVYSRQLQVYKGIDNKLEFKLVNADQKPIDVSAYTPRFQAFDENKNLIIEHDGEVNILDDSSASRGLFTVTITENDLLNVKQQYLSYSIHLVDTNGNASITYSDSHFGNSGIIKVSTEAYPAPLSSKVVTFPTDGNLTSSVVEAQPGINGNEALHTSVVYTDGYVGDLTVQATLDTDETTASWADVITVSFDGTETAPKPINFNGVFSYIRFVSSASPLNTITKILIRN